MLKRFILSGLYLISIFALFFVLSPKQSAFALACSKTTYTDVTETGPSCPTACSRALNICESGGSCPCYRVTSNCPGNILTGYSCTYTKQCTSTWTCSSTTCGSSSSSATDPYCTYLSGVSCGSTAGTCWYSSSSKYDSRCGSTCSTTTPTPTQPPCPTTAPTGLSPSGTLAAGTNSVTLSWNAVAGAGWYNIRVDDGVNDVRDSRNNCSSLVLAVCINGYSGGTSITINTIPGRTYNWTIIPNNTGCGGGPSASSSFYIPTVSPPCNSGISCGACSISSPSCGTGSQTCTYTTYTGGGACTQAPAPSQSCTVGCSAGYICSSGTCIINTFSISGNVYVDSDNNGTKDSNYTGGGSMTLSNGATAPINGSGNYTFSNLAPASYTVTLPATPGYYRPVTSQSTTVGPNQVLNFRLVPLSTLNINVYNDYNGNGVQDASDTAASGQTVTITGGSAQTYTTNGVTKTISGLNPGSSTITVTPGSGWTSTTTNPRTVTYPPTPQTVNFGIRPPAPTCSGGLSASPISVNPGGASTLTAAGCTTPTGATPTYTYYDDSTIVGDSVTNNNTNTSAWTAPNPYWTQTVANPSVAVCNPGGAGALCSNYGAAVTIIPVFSVSGNVFVDQNKDQLLNGSDANYTGGISISPNPAGATVTYPNPAGNYLISGLTGGNYTIYYNGPPVGYQMTYPQVVPPPSFSVRVGNASTGGACSESSNSAACDANGNISALRYGITNSIPWIQSTGGDITGSNISNPTGGGFTDTIPSGASCGTYASLNGAGGTPGIIHSGAGSYSFGSGQASPNPSNWVIGGSAYPDTYVLPSNVIRTSYNYISSIAKQSGITPTDIASYCGGGGIANCALSASLSNGVYIANGSLTLTGAPYTFPANKNFVILVNGNLNIQTEVHVPVGSTAFFTSSGDIYVDSGVGEAVITSTRANVEGYFSSDRNFIVQSLDSTGKGLNCPTSDRRLNVAGAIVVNAALGGGSFTNQRDLCLGNLQCPAFMVTERPDFILNTPDFFKTTRRVWQEIAP